MHGQPVRLENRASTRVVVTGGAGFIGSELVRVLLARGCSVTVIDSLVNGRRKNVEEPIARGVRLEVLDIRDVTSVKPLLHGADVVYHLACLGVCHSIHSPLENHEVNAGATLRLLQAARESEVHRFVYVSSSEVYGTARWTPMDEHHPTTPTTVYGASKLAGESYTGAYHDTYGLETTIVRPFNTYGPRCHHEGDCGEVIPKFMLRSLADRPLLVFGDGSQTRDFTHVSDTARGIVEAGFRDDAAGQTINLGTGIETSISELAEIVRDVVSVPRVRVRHLESRPGDVGQHCADTAKALDLLGFSPEVSLPEGLARLRDWYRSLDETPEELLVAEQQHNWLAQRSIAKELVAARPVDEFERISAERASDRWRMESR